MKPKLQQLQQQFVDTISRRQPSSIVDYLDSAQRLSASERVSIYQNNYRMTMVNALATTYPVCVKLVGEDFFRMLTEKYIQQSPSHSFSLNDYGAGLAQFIANVDAAKAVPYLADMASLEWACHRASLSADSLQFDYQALAAVAEERREQIVFELPPGAHLLASEFPVLRIWEYAQAAAESAAPFNMEQFAAERLLVFRAGLGLRMDLLTDMQWQLLQAIADGVCFGRLCEQFSDHITEQLPKLISQGWIQGFH